MSRVEEVLREVESLEPDDRLRLLAALWETLPPDHWAAPSRFQQAEYLRHINKVDAAPEVEVGPVDDAPWKTLNLVFNPAWDAEPSKLYHATRRFDLATVFVAMSVYAILLALMSAVPEFGIATRIYLGLFVVCVGVGQALLEPYTDSRRASIVVGAAFQTFCSFVYWAAFNPPWWYLNSFFVVVVLNGLIGGAAMGYLAGALVGGVYLLADVLRGRFGRAPKDDLVAAQFDDVQLSALSPLENVSTRRP